MIQSIRSEQYLHLNRLLAADSARAYFIRLGLLNPATYTSVQAESAADGTLKALLCQRRSGTLQFWAAPGFDAEGFEHIMASLQWETFISPEGCCRPVMDAGLFREVTPGAWIAKLKALKPFEAAVEFQPLRLEDLDEVSALYDVVFDHHMSVAQMRSKLETGRGRGVVLRREGRIVCAAQTEFEEPDSALIVGIATHPVCQRNGLAAACTGQLCQALLAEGKTPWLQYDNPVAGRLYSKLGFVNVDRVLHCRR